MKRDSDMEWGVENACAFSSKTCQRQLEALSYLHMILRQGGAIVKQTIQIFLRHPGGHWHHLKYCSLFLKWMAPLEAIIVTFVNRINRRTNIVHLSIKMKNWNKHLGLPSPNCRWCVLERYPRTGCTNTTYLPSKGLISPLTGYTVTWTYSTLCRWQLALPLLNNEFPRW